MYFCVSVTFMHLAKAVKGEICVEIRTGNRTGGKGKLPPFPFPPPSLPLSLPLEVGPPKI